MFQREPTALSIDFIYNASDAKLAVIYKRLQLKFKYINNHLWFNKQCLVHQVIPKYISVKCSNKSTSAKRAVHHAKQFWLKSEIRKWYIQRYHINLHLKLIHSELVYRLHNIEFDALDQQIRESVANQGHIQFLKQLNKLEKLIQTSRNASNHNHTRPKENNPEKKEFYPRIRNISSTPLNEAETTLLSKGLQYSPNIKVTKSHFQNLALDTEAALHNNLLDPIKKAECASIIKKDFYSYKFHKQSSDAKKDISLVNSIKNKLNDNDLILCKADKGNTIAILDKSDYVSKVNSFILDNKLININSDPTNKYQKQIINTVKQCSTVLDQQDKYRLISMNPSTPLFFGLPKLHKKNYPIRPVVSYVNAPAYKLCKKLNSVLPDYLDFQPKYTVKNSIDLITKIEHTSLPANSRLVSFDICSLFTSIPLKELKNILETQLSYCSSNTKTELMELINLCLDQNYFTFDSNIYKQEDGLPMGSPLSPLFADIFMNDFEIKLFSSKNSYISKIMWWYRYVDDIICLWTGTDRQLDCFLTFLNSLNSKIQFTIEKEINKKINFLDITIMHDHKKLAFNVYRKPTYTDTIIPYSSNHPLNIKLSAFHSFTHRLLKIPLSKYNFKTELHRIKEIATNNGYNPLIVDKMVRRKQRQALNKHFYLNSNNEEKVKTYRKISYIGKTSHVIAKNLKPLNITSAFYNKNTIKNLLVNNKIYTRDKLKQSGIYEIKCNNCNFIYIGQTGRNFDIRFAEHMRSWRLKKYDSNVSKHMLENNHNFDVNSLRILHVNKKGLKMNLLEALEINKAVSQKKDLMNEQLELNTSPLLQPF